MRPESIKKFDMLYLGAVVLGLINFVLSYQTVKAQMDAEMAASGIEVGAGVLIGSIIFGVVISLALWFLISRLRIEVVKWVLILFFLWGLIGLPALFAGDFEANDLIVLVTYAMQAAAIYFLFQPDAKAWFAEKRNGAGVRTDSDTRAD